jgi:hypothetical protein
VEFDACLTGITIKAAVAIQMAPRIGGVSPRPSFPFGFYRRLVYQNEFAKRHSRHGGAHAARLKPSAFVVTVKQHCREHRRALPWL